ncbi:Protein FAM98A, partial [Papilio machaon]
YDGPLSDPDAFSKAIDDGLKSLDFIKLVCELAEELKTLCKVEESVNMINSLEETSSFMLELSSFLKELGCPYRGLISGHMSSRLQTKEIRVTLLDYLISEIMAARMAELPIFRHSCMRHDLKYQDLKQPNLGHMSSRLQTKEIRVTLLDYLISEIMAARMVSVDCPNENQPPNMDIVMQESPTAKALKEILIALKFNKPPPNITPEVLFSKLEVKLKDTIQKEGQQLVGKPLYNKALTEKDWKELDNIFTEMYDEYRLRRETLISRLECTIQSFEWSDRLKGKKDQIQAIYRPKREQMKVKPEVKLCDFLAARTSLLHVDKTSSANVRKNTQSEVNKVIIGQVPDRGGRPNEQQPPPPEMPSWQQRSAPQGGRGGGGQRGGRGDGSGGGGRGRGGGGRVQGGYNQGQQDQNRSQNQNYNQNQNQNQRNYQTFEVPPGGYGQNYHSNQGYNQNQYNQGYGNNQGYDSAGGYNQGYTTPARETDCFKQQQKISRA